MGKTETGLGKKGKGKEGKGRKTLQRKEKEQDEVRKQSLDAVWNLKCSNYELFYLQNMIILTL